MKRDPSFSAIAFDLDGTLLNSQSRLSERNLLALWECNRKGIVLYVATGRPKRLVFRPGEVTGEVSFLTTRGAFYNGAEAIDQTLNHVRHWSMPGKLVGDLIGYLMAVTPPVQIVIQKGEDYHSFRLPMDEVALSDWGFSGEELRPFSEASQQECSKIVAWHETQDLVKVYQGLSNRYGGRVNTFLTDSGRWLQMMSREASKERALLDLLALRGIPPEKVVVWGDDTPDLGMFRTFGCSVAMANAPAVLRNAATYVTRSNDEDGVAFALEEYLGLR